MRYRDTKKRHTNYVLRLVCEGNKSEPLFFTDLCYDYLKDQDQIDSRTIPTPYPSNEEEEIPLKRGSYQGKKREIKNFNKADRDNEIPGAPPLKWVLYGQKLLSEGIDEVWVIFDKDNHPAHLEAFKTAEKKINNKKVNIAFSSRSFEYYILLHFEYIYKEFLETECGERIKGKKKIYFCGTNISPDKDCHGEKCINGYARTKKYWEESKSNKSLYPLVKDKLLIGLVNSCILREQSNAMSSLPIYERNPYTNVDRLVGRIINTQVIPPQTKYTIHGYGQEAVVCVYTNKVVLTNESLNNSLFASGFFQILNYETLNIKKINEKNILLRPGDNIELDVNFNLEECLNFINASGKRIILLPPL